MAKDLNQIADLADREGLAYALTDGGHLAPEDFEDPRLRAAAREVRDGLRMIEHALLESLKR